MCLIAYQPEGDKPFEAAVFENGWSANQHGAGYMFAIGGKLVVRKPFYKLKELRAAYDADHAQFGAASAFVIHFRYATHGDKGEANVHPHRLAYGEAALAHNGVLHDFEGWGKESDTAFFCRTVLAHRTSEQLVDEKFGTFLSGIIGQYNKFAIMTATGHVSIVNSQAGEWDGGRWYSNGGWDAPKPRQIGLAPGTGWVSRGAVFDSTEAAVHGFRRQFADAKYATLPVERDNIPDPTPDDEIEALHIEIADAHAAGDGELVEELTMELWEWEHERDQWAAAELAMARDGD